MSGTLRPPSPLGKPPFSPHPDTVNIPSDNRCPTIIKPLQTLGFLHSQKKSKKSFDGGCGMVQSVSVMNQNLLLTTIASARSTPTHHHRVQVTDMESAIAFIRSRFADVDWDPFPDRVTIFGDDTSVEGDEDEGRFSIDLIRPVSLTANPYAE